MTRIDLITGFLGSGKTTFIKEYAGYLSSLGKRVAIIVNDYGAINVDRMLLGDALSSSCHLEMVIGGDADCTRRRLKTKLITVAMTGYDHVIVEPSGIFEVEEFYDLLYEEPLEKWYQMGSVITIMESGISEDLSGEAEYIFTSQIAKSGIVIVSKISPALDALSNPDALNKQKEEDLKYINSCLEKYGCSRRLDDLYYWKQGEITSEDFEKILRSTYHSDALPKYRSGGHPDNPTGEINGDSSDNNSFESTFFFHPKIETEKIEETVRLIFDDPDTGNVIRLKGFLKNSDDNWLEINATRHTVNICPISGGQELFIVIGEGLNHKKIRYILKSDEKIVGTD